MFFLNQGNIPKLFLPEDTNIMLLEVGLTVPDEKSVQEKTKSFKVFSKRMTINWVGGRGREGKAVVSTTMSICRSSYGEIQSGVLIVLGYQKRYFYRAIPYPG